MQTLGQFWKPLYNLYQCIPQQAAENGRRELRVHGGKGKAMVMVDIHARASARRLN
jgi:hypothetical protein